MSIFLRHRAKGQKDKLMPVMLGKGIIVSQLNLDGEPRRAMVQADPSVWVSLEQLVQAEANAAVREARLIDRLRSANWLFWMLWGCLVGSVLYGVLK